MVLSMWSWAPDVPVIASYLRLLGAFASQKPGIWGERWWYAFLTITGAVLLLALIVNAILTAVQAAGEATYRRHAVLLTSIALIGGLFYSSVTPPWQAPDEHAHYEYAALMAELKRVPTLADVRQEIQAEVTASMFAFDFWRLIKRQPVETAPLGFYRAGDLTEYPPTHVINNRYIYYPQIGNEPPTYYLLPALLYEWSAEQDATFHLYVMRIGSVFFWVCLAAATWWASRELSPDQARLALAAVTLVIFNPMLSHICTVLSNDGLAALWSTLALGVLTVIYRKGMTWGRGLLLLALTLLAVLTKKSTLWVVPTVALAFLFVPRIPLRWRLRGGAVLAATAVVTLGLLLCPTDRARYWQGGIRLREGGRAGNHVLAVPEGKHVAQRLGHQRTFSLRGQTVVAEALLRSNRPSKVNVCISTESGPRQCRQTSSEGAWRSVKVSFVVPDQAEQVELAFTGSSSTRVWLDDVALTPDEGENLLRNGSIESGVSWLERLLVTTGQPLGIGGLVTGLFANSASQLGSVGNVLPTAWRVFFDSFWGNFGAAMVVPLKAPWPVLTRIAAGLALLGWIPNLARREGMGKSWQKRTVGVMALGLSLALAQTFVRLFVQSGGWMPQGRFVFPAIWPIATLLVLGWWGWRMASTKRCFLIWVTLPALALYLGGTWRLISYFYG